MNIHAFATLLAAGGQQQSIWPTLIMFGAIIAIFYFLLIRPQRKQQQEHEEMVASLKKGDQVVTLGGIVGEIVHIEDDQLVLKTAGDTRLDMERSKVGRKVGAEEEEEG